jgi:hypothetical protein
LTFVRQSPTLTPMYLTQLRLTMRFALAVLSLSVIGTLAFPLAESQAQTAPRAAMAQTPQSAATDMSAQSRRVRRPPTRIRIYPRYIPDADGVYPRYFPGRNAVRDCTATYVQEFRPSGTVIVPRLNCFWRPG